MKFIAPIILALLYKSLLIAAFLMGMEPDNLIHVLSAIISVGIAHFIWPSSAFVVGLVMFIVSVVLPLLIKFALLQIENSNISPYQYLDDVIWYLLILPTVVATIAALLMKRITNHSKTQGEKPPCSDAA